MRGIHTKLNVIWDWEAPAGGGDTHFAFYKGTRARVEVRQTKADKYLPELYVVPASAELKPQVLAAVKAKIASLQKEFPGVGVEERGAGDPHHDSGRAARRSRGALRAGHRSLLEVSARPQGAARVGAAEHGGEVLRHDKGAELSREGPPRVAERIAPK